ncbi:hypothetical protein [Paenibacillus sp.]|jgi:hypothetical protein|uniref:hypothetical protein n=1 Tax=Paenibacillus sp. TaxID=58172 RepID=UPI0028238264|nr:hypothetical protein [Paenibacillus sp.]MDR0268400.1 hypothetical protein [Paenibacillus sp.]
MKFKSIIVSFVAVLVFGLIGGMSYATPVEESTELTIEGYTAYLEEKINNGEFGAKETLEKFKNLDIEQQKAFLKFLGRSDYIELFQLSASRSDIEKYYDIDGVTVPVSVKQEVSGLTSDGDTFNTLAASVETSASISEFITIFGVEVSTLTLTCNWEHNGSSATKALQVKHAHANMNPAWIISEQSNSHPGYISGGYFNGSGSWTMYATGTIGAISHSLSLGIKGKTPSEKYYNFHSAHPNMTNIPWTRF